MIVTSEKPYKQRRDFFRLGVGALIGSSLIVSRLSALNLINDTNTNKLEISNEELATDYINFYEFSTDRRKAVSLARNFNTQNWKIDTSKEMEKPFTFSIEGILKLPLGGRIYRFRCIETWSMVVPWVGFELRRLVDMAKSTSEAKSVKFTILLDKSQSPDRDTLLPTIEYPYMEGLHMDEAMHPLTLFAVGMYRKALKPQSEAPIRLVVPWKYEFKSTKSIVKIESIKKQSIGIWEKYVPNEYGLYANASPNVSRPRWSQVNGRILGDFFAKPISMFNGYEKEVASPYADMGLKTNY